MIRGAAPPYLSCTHEEALMVASRIVPKVAAARGCRTAIIQSRSLRCGSRSRLRWAGVCAPR